MKKPTRYDFSRPIKIISYKSPRFDIIFYSFILSLLMLGLFVLLFIHDGRFAIAFTLPRVLIGIPLIMVAYLFKQLLDELRIYPEKLLTKHVWKIEELMQLTGKDRKETENIISHVLEAAFIVDDKNIIE